MTTKHTEIGFYSKTSGNQYYLDIKVSEGEAEIIKVAILNEDTSENEPVDLKTFERTENQHAAYNEVYDYLSQKEADDRYDYESEGYDRDGDR